MTRVDVDFETLRSLIHQYGLREAERIARRIARGLDALQSLRA